MGATFFKPVNWITSIIKSGSGSCHGYELWRGEFDSAGNGLVSCQRKIRSKPRFPLEKTYFTGIG